MDILANDRKTTKPAKHYSSLDYCSRISSAGRRIIRWGPKPHTKSAALEVVGESFGVSVGTLRTWETKWLPDIYPDVKSLFQIAKRAGEIQRCIDKDPDFETDDLVAISLANALSITHPLQAIAEAHRTAQQKARTQPRRPKKVS